MRHSWPLVFCVGLLLGGCGSNDTTTSDTTTTTGTSTGTSTGTTSDTTTIAGSGTTTTTVAGETTTTVEGATTTPATTTTTAGSGNTGGSTSSSPSTPGSSSTTKPTSPPDDDPAYMPWGANDPLIPGQYAALTASSLADLDCSRLADQVPPGDAFWATVVDVCRAITGTGGWPANYVTAPSPGNNVYQACLNKDLATMVSSVVKWHQAHPGATQKLRFPAASTKSPCQTRTYGEVTAREATPDELPDGGVVVTLSAPALGNVDDSQVTVDGASGFTNDFSDDQGEGLFTGDIFLPAPVEAHVAKITVESDFGLVSAKVALPEVASSATTSTSSVPVDTTTTSTTASST
jgi:hypothetical protein